MVHTLHCRLVVGPAAGQKGKEAVLSGFEEEPAGQAWHGVSKSFTLLKKPIGHSPHAQAIELQYPLAGQGMG